MLMYGRNQHNTVIILQLKINKLRKKREGTVSSTNGAGEKMDIHIQYNKVGSLYHI